MAMEEVLASFVVDHEKSSYRIELMKAASGKIYISLEQTVYAVTTQISSVVKMKPQALDEILKVLVEVQQASVLHIAEVVKKGRLTPNEKKELIYRYLNKNLSLETLAGQFDCTVDAIKQLFWEENIAIVSSKVSDYKPGKKYRSRKKNYNR